MNPLTFTAFLCWLTILIVLSFTVDYLLSKIFESRGHRYFVWLGVIIHELSHAVACLLTRTRITKIKLFEPEGGYVTHEKRRNPLVTTIIALAPLFGCSLFLLFLAWLFCFLPHYFGIPGVIFNYKLLRLDNNIASIPDAFYMLILILGAVFYDNLMIAFISPLTGVLFILFLYFVASVSACIAPSPTDLKHALCGLILFIVLGFGAIFIKPLQYIPGVTQFFGTPTPVLDFVVAGLSIAISVGVVGVLLTIAILAPIAIIRKR